jgi:hypothetical protein
MDKLLMQKHTVEEIEQTGFGELMATELAKDWLAMDKELVRLNTAIEGAMEEMRQQKMRSTIQQGKVYDYSIDILNKHLGCSNE